MKPKLTIPALLLAIALPAAGQVRWEFSPVSAAATSTMIDTQGKELGVWNLFACNEGPRRDIYEEEFYLAAGAGLRPEPRGVQLAQRGIDRSKKATFARILKRAGLIAIPLIAAKQLSSNSIIWVSTIVAVADTYSDALTKELQNAQQLYPDLMPHVVTLDPKQCGHWRVISSRVPNAATIHGVLQR